MLVAHNIDKYPFPSIVYDLINVQKPFRFGSIYNISDSNLIIAANIILNEGNNNIKV